MTDQEILQKAISQAVDNGWKYRPIDQFGNEVDLELDELPERLSSDSRIALIFHHDFAKAFWGSKPVDDYGNDMLAIRLYFKQVAVWVLGKLRAVPNDYNALKLLTKEKAPKSEQIEPVVPAHQEITMQLEHKFASIPFTTHRLEELEITGTIPAWQFHLREQVISDNPIGYLRKGLK